MGNFVKHWADPPKFGTPFEVYSVAPGVAHI